MKKSRRGLIIVVMIVFALTLMLTACAKTPELDLTGFVEVTYDLMGGNIDGMTVKRVMTKIGNPAIEPKGSTNLVEAKRFNHTLDGWYTDYEASYSPAVNGDYVYLENGVYLEDNEGSYVYVEVIATDEEGNEIYDIVGEDENGNPIREYVYEHKYILYDEELHGDLPRYRQTSDYVLYDENNISHQGLTRYQGDFYFDPQDRWDFSSDVVTESIRLYAKWNKNLNIVYVHDYSSPDAERGITFPNGKRGELLPSTSYAPPARDGYSFTVWYKDRELTEKWDFSTDIFPEDESITEVRLYAGYIEGSYTRLQTIQDINRMRNNPSRNFVLVNDIDMEGAAITTSLFGDSVFTGTIEGMGNSITNFTISATHFNNRPIEETPKNYGVLSAINGGAINNLTASYTIKIGLNSNKGMIIGGLVGKADNSMITGCNISVEILMADDGSCQSDIVYGELIGSSDDKSKITLENNEIDFIQHVRTTGTIKKFVLG